MPGPARSARWIPGVDRDGPASTIVPICGCRNRTSLTGLVVVLLGVVRMSRVNLTPRLVARSRGTRTVVAMVAILLTSAIPAIPVSTVVAADPTPGFLQPVAGDGKTTTKVLGGITTQSVGTPVSGFGDTEVITGLHDPTSVQFASDGRVFVAEKSGQILVYDNLADSTPTVFATSVGQVDDYWDRGLLGMTLGPDFPTSPYVYVLYARETPLDGALAVVARRMPFAPGSDQ